MFHTPNTHLVPLQAEAAGLPLVAVGTEGIEEAELADLTRAIRLAVEQHGIEGVVTGALLSVYRATRIRGSAGTSISGVSTRSGTRTRSTT